MVYFITDEELSLAERRLRDVQVDDEWRGWSFEAEPMKPPYNIKLPLSSIANKYCETGRDLYLYYVEGRRGVLTPEVLAGSIYHRVVAAIVDEAKGFIYKYGLMPGAELYDYLIRLRDGLLDGFFKDYGLKCGELKDVRRNAEKLWLYESLEVSSSLNKAMALKSFKSIDALIQAFIPFVVEYSLSGERIGLRDLRLDALGTFMVVYDLKTGSRRDFHRLTTTGYALALESQRGHPVNIGCVTYLSFKHDVPTPIIRRDIHVIEEPLRRWFIDERDSKMEIIVNRVDPGKPSTCDLKCPFKKFCSEEFP